MSAYILHELAPESLNRRHCTLSNTHYVILHWYPTTCDMFWRGKQLSLLLEASFQFSNAARQYLLYSKEDMYPRKSIVSRFFRRYRGRDQRDRDWKMHRHCNA
jgi:hypothetical protein